MPKDNERKARRAKRRGTLDKIGDNILSFVQGATLGLADEMTALEAASRYGGTYEEHHKRIQEAVNRGSWASELAGGLVTGVATGGALGAAGAVGRRFLPQAALAAGEGAVAGAAGSAPGERVVGGTVGGIAGGALGAAGHGVGVAARKFYLWIRPGKAKLDEVVREIVDEADPRALNNPESLLGDMTPEAQTTMAQLAGENATFRKQATEVLKNRRATGTARVFESMNRVIKPKVTFGELNELTEVRKPQMKILYDKAYGTADAPEGLAVLPGVKRAAAEVSDELQEELSSLPTTLRALDTDTPLAQALKTPPFMSASNKVRGSYSDVSGIPHSWNNNPNYPTVTYLHRVLQRMRSTANKAISSASPDNDTFQSFSNAADLLEEGMFDVFPNFKAAQGFAAQGKIVTEAFEAGQRVAQNSAEPRVLPEELSALSQRYQALGQRFNFEAAPNEMDDLFRSGFADRTFQDMTANMERAGIDGSVLDKLGRSRLHEKLNFLGTEQEHTIFNQTLSDESRFVITERLMDKAVGKDLIKNPGQDAVMSKAANVARLFGGLGSPGLAGIGLAQGGLRAARDKGLGAVRKDLPPFLLENNPAKLPMGTAPAGTTPGLNPYHSGISPVVGNMLYGPSGSPSFEDPGPTNPAADDLWR